MDLEAKLAVDRLLDLAEGDTGGSRAAANFLLAWWNAGDLGGFDPTDLWRLDDRTAGDLLIALGYLRRHQDYPTALGVDRARLEGLIRRWRPGLAGAVESEG